MTDKRERIITDPGLGPQDPHRPSTLRSLEPADAAADPNSNSPVYYEPTPLVAISNHKTLEVQTVKLSDEIDPRKLQTELRLDRVPSHVPPSDSFWPPETALASSQPPPSAPRRWRAPAVLIALSCVLLVLVIARATVRRSAALAARQSGIAQTVSGAGLTPVDTHASPTLPRPVASPSSLFKPAVSATAQLAHPLESAVAARTPAPSTTATSVQSVASLGSATHVANASPVSSSTPLASAAPLGGVAPAGNAAQVGHSPIVAQHAANPTPAPSAPLAAPSASKPKRAIY